ncbi:MAG: hypothetical protein ACSHXB_08955 [Sulfitobacter sp.]
MIIDVLGCPVPGTLADCRFHFGMVKDLITLAITLVGTIFAAYYGYLRFVHGRLYSEQLAPKIDLKVTRVGQHHWLIAMCEMKNTGIRKVRLKHRNCSVKFSAVYPEGIQEKSEHDQFLFPHNEREFRVVQVFAKDDAIDPNEIIQDSAAVLLTGMNPDGYKATFRISEETEPEKLGRRNTSWTTDDYEIYSPAAQTEETKNEAAK